MIILIIDSPENLIPLIVALVFVLMAANRKKDAKD